MLCLVRKKNESITILTASGETILLKILKVESNRVQIGVQAKQDVRIMRTELLDRRVVDRNTDKS